MGEPVPPMIVDVEYPHIRSYVMEALEELRDLAINWAHYRRDPEGTTPFLDLTSSFHILYDDYLVLPNPESALGEVLIPSDVAPLVSLDAALGPMVEDLGNVRDDVYLADPRWPSVVAAAEAALQAMQRPPTRGDES